MRYLILYTTIYRSVHSNYALYVMNYPCTYVPLSSRAFCESLKHLSIVSCSHTSQHISHVVIRWEDLSPPISISVNIDIICKYVYIHMSLAARMTEFESSSYVLDSDRKATMFYNRTHSSNTA